MRRWIAAVVGTAVVTAAAAAGAQRAPSFDVATIKPSREDSGPSRIGNAGGGRWQMGWEYRA